jgi:hypothetical protein
VTASPLAFLGILFIEIDLNLVLDIAEKGPDKDIFDHVFLLLEHSLRQGVCQRMIQVE